MFITAPFLSTVLKHEKFGPIIQTVLNSSNCLLLFDELHQLKAGYIKAFTKLRATFKLGLTATPFTTEFKNYKKVIKSNIYDVGFGDKQFDKTICIQVFQWLDSENNRQPYGDMLSKRYSNV